LVSFSVIGICTSGIAANPRSFEFSWTLQFHYVHQKRLHNRDTYNSSNEKAAPLLMKQPPSNYAGLGSAVAHAERIPRSPCAEKPTF
jgi:hypothetical protein